MELLKEKIVDLFAESKITVVEYRTLLKNLKELVVAIKQHEITSFDGEPFMYLCRFIIAKNKYSFQNEFEQFKGTMTEEEFYIHVWRSYAAIRSTDDAIMSIMLCDLCRLCDLPKLSDRVEDLSVASLLSNKLSTDLFNMLCEVLTEEGIPYEIRKDLTACIPEMSQVKQNLCNSAESSLKTIYNVLDSAVFRGEYTVQIDCADNRVVEKLMAAGFNVVQNSRHSMHVMVPVVSYPFSATEDELAKWLKTQQAADYGKVAGYCKNVLIPWQFAECCMEVAELLQDVGGKPFVSFQMPQTRTDVSERLIRTLTNKGYAVRVSEDGKWMEIGGWFDAGDVGVCGGEDKA